MVGMAAGAGAGAGGGSWRPETSHPAVSYKNVGGIELILNDIRELVEWPLTHPEIYAAIGVQPPRGVLLHGPPGCGKTLLANAIGPLCSRCFYCRCRSH